MAYSFKGKVAARPSRRTDGGNGYRVPIILTAEEAVKFVAAGKQLFNEVNNTVALSDYATHYGEHTIYVNQSASYLTGGLQVGSACEVSLKVSKAGYYDVAAFATGKEKAAFDAARAEADEQLQESNQAIAAWVKMGLSRQQALVMQLSNTTGVLPTEIAKMMALLPSSETSPTKKATTGVAAKKKQPQPQPQGGGDPADEGGDDPADGED